jgi:hypothetical protein
MMFDLLLVAIPEAGRASAGEEDRKDVETSVDDTKRLYGSREASSGGLGVQELLSGYAVKLVPNPRQMVAQNPVASSIQLL